MHQSLQSQFWSLLNNGAVRRSCSSARKPTSSSIWDFASTGNFTSRQYLSDCGGCSVSQNSHPQRQSCHYFVHFRVKPVVNYSILKSIRLITYGLGAIWSCTSTAETADLANSDGLLRRRIWRRTPTALAVELRRAGEKHQNLRDVHRHAAEKV